MTRDQFHLLLKQLSCLNIAVTEGNELGSACTSPIFAEVCNQLDLTTVETTLAEILTELQTQADYEYIGILCDPTEGQVVVEIIDGVKSFTNFPAGTPFTGDTSTLTSCPAEVIDKDVTRIDFCIDGVQFSATVVFDHSDNTEIYTNWKDASGNTLATDPRIGATTVNIGTCSVNAQLKDFCVTLVTGEQLNVCAKIDLDSDALSYYTLGTTTLIPYSLPTDATISAGICGCGLKGSQGTLTDWSTIK